MAAVPIQEVDIESPHDQKDTSTALHVMHTDPDALPEHEIDLILQQDLPAFDQTEGTVGVGEDRISETDKLKDMEEEEEEIMSVSSSILQEEDIALSSGTSCHVRLFS